MKFHIITIFPEAFESFIHTSIIGKGIKNNLFEIEIYKLGDFSDKNFKHVDDKAYGMHGQVISPEPLAKAIEYIKKKIIKNNNVGVNLCVHPENEQIVPGYPQGVHPTKYPIIYMSPSGELLTQERVEKYSREFQEEDIIIICGHYEGIDQRIIDLYVTHQISIGEYVLTSGELSSQVFIDSLVRHIPGVLGNKQSLEEESFSNFFDRQKEHPVYTRPQEFMGITVPSVLTSGNHKKIEQWKQSQKRK